MSKKGKVPKHGTTGGRRRISSKIGTFESDPFEPQQITIRINGVTKSATVEPRRLLVDLIRTQFSLTGTHIGCDTSQCGTCTVLLNGSAVKSCSMFAVQADESEIMTIEGLAQDGKLHPLQEEFMRNHALQCGFCTPGMIMSSLGFLKENQNPSEEEIKLGISGNLCRCTGYQNIIKAVQAAAIRLRNESLIVS